MNQEQWLDKAYIIAIAAHEKQTDKGGEPYLGHLRRVSNQGETTQEKIVGLLHDVVEDCNFPIEAINKEFGCDPRIAEAILILTHPPNEPYIDYVRRIRISGGIALRVKRYDVLDNIRFERMVKLDVETQYRLLGKYYAALRILTNKDFTNCVFRKMMFFGSHLSDFQENAVETTALACRRLYRELLNGQRKVKLYSQKRKKKKHSRRF